MISAFWENFYCNSRFLSVRNVGSEMKKKGLPELSVKLHLLCYLPEWEFPLAGVHVFVPHSRKMLVNCLRNSGVDFQMEMFMPFLSRTFPVIPWPGNHALARCYSLWITGRIPSPQDGRCQTRTCRTHAFLWYQYGRLRHLRYPQRLPHGWTSVCPLIFQEFADHHGFEWWSIVITDGGSGHPLTQTVLPQCWWRDFKGGKILKFTDMTHEITGMDRLKNFVQLFRDW